MAPKSNETVAHDWRSVPPLDVVRGRAWRSGLFCTFALSLGFFEAVLLPHFRRSGARELDIVADLTGVRDALGESGAREVGRAYTVNPCWTLDGVFHPKLSLLENEEEAHLLLGSGNLTFGGWGLNTEVVEHLVMGAHPAAFADVADFLEALATSPRIRFGDRSVLERWSERARKRTRGAAEGPVRVLHNVDRSIVDQLVAFAEELGGARDISVVSPYFGGPTAVKSLAGRLDVKQVEVHVPKSLPYRGEYFPFHKAKFCKPVEIEVVANEEASLERALHAKVIEVVCQRGRLLLTGSINASVPALIQRGNVELGVLRVYPSPKGGLARNPVSAPKVATTEAAEENAVSNRDVVFASAAGGTIKGLLLSPAPEGDWSLSLAWPSGRLSCGDVTVETSGDFSAEAPLDRFEYAAGRVLVQLRRETRVAEGFLALSDNLELGRAIGAAAGAIMRTATGAGDDEDLATVLEWIARHPDDALAPWRKSRERRPEEPEDGRVIGGIDADILSDDELGVPLLARGGPGRSALERLLARLRAQIQQVPHFAPLAADHEYADIEDLDEEEDSPTPGGLPPTDRVLNALDILWETLAAGVASDPPATLLLMADFAKFVVTRRNAPRERIQRLVEDWIAVAIRYPETADDEELLPVARLFVVLGAALGGAPVRARRRLLHLAVGAGGDPFDIEVAPVQLGNELIVASCGVETFEATRLAILTARTAYEDLLLVRAALSKGEEIPALQVLEEEPEIAAIRRLVARGRADRVRFLFNDEDYCPLHGRKLPVVMAHRLKDLGLVGTECCDRILVNLRP